MKVCVDICHLILVALTFFMCRFCAIFGIWTTCLIRFTWISYCICGWDLLVSLQFIFVIFSFSFFNSFYLLLFWNLYIFGECTRVSIGVNGMSGQAKNPGTLNWAFCTCFEVLPSPIYFLDLFIRFYSSK